MLKKLRENTDTSVKSKIIQVTGCPSGSVLPSTLWIFETYRSRVLLQGRQSPSDYKDRYRQLAPHSEFSGAHTS